MVRVDHAVSAKARLLQGGASAIVMGMFLAAAPAAAYAQDQAAAAPDATPPLSAQTGAAASTATAADADAPDDADTIIVTGQRRALQTSQGIKRNADTVVDSITATDIGAFPDKSVAEALQRVPGITVNRFAATSDTAHFSAEPSGVIVRGLPQVRSEFNGRDTFSANSSRGLSWGDITPELMAGVDTYKNQTAEMIEGGIAGSINLRTRVPFDAPGQLIQGAVNINYNDLSKKFTPDFNVFYSNRWETGAGEFGLMANFAYSQVITASQGIQYGRAAIIDNGFGPTGPATAYMPASVNFLDNQYNRKRQGIAAAAQWRNLDHTMLLTAQYNRSVYKNKWQERSFGSFGIGPDLYGFNVRTRVVGNGGNLHDRIPVPAAGTPAFTFDEDGNFQSGVVTRSNAENSMWWGAPDANPGFGVNEAGQPMFNACYNWGGSAGCERDANGVAHYGVDVGTGSRVNQNRNMTQDFGLNFKWDATDRLHFNFDGQYVDSTVDNYDISVEHHSFANVGLDATGKYPRITLGDPSNINQSPGGLANANNWYLRSVMDHLEASEGTQWAFRGDMEYDIGTTWLDSIKVGARYADRDQTVRWSTYNWANVANTWTDSELNQHSWNLDSYKPFGAFKGYPQGMFEISEFGEPFFGGSLGSFPFVPFDALNAHRADEYNRSLIGIGEFTPICQRAAELPDSCFIDNEIADVSETVKSAYAMVRFGGRDAKIGNVPVSGNFGLRYVNTKNVSSGFLRYPVNNYDFTQCDGLPPVVPPGSPTPPVPPINDPAQCYLSAQDLAFINGGGVASTAERTHNHFLPSFNIRFDLSDKWLLRFAASRAMSRPDIGLLKNFLSVSAGLPNATDPTDPRWVKDSTGKVVGVNPTYEASAYNPYLAPTTAWQFDVSIENYFANVGSFSLAAFYKTFQNYIQYGSYTTTVSRDGIDRDVFVRGPMNGKGAKIKGFEIAYTRYFDFLPEPLNGFGIQANYTYVSNSGIPNANLTPVGSTGQVTNAGNAGTALNPGALEGLSKHSFNLVGMYEKGRIAARLAYNWRSEFLVTAVDCCVYLPVWQRPSGFLDGSIRFRATDNIEISVQGSNLLNTKTKLQTQVTDEDSPEGKRILVPNGWFQNDRRFVFGVRVRY